MKQVKDRTGQTWVIDITVGAVKRVRDLCGGIDLLSIADPNKQVATLRDQISDPCTFGMVFYAVCFPQIEERGLTPEAFAELWNGETMEIAADSLIDDIFDFFPPQKRQILHKAFQKVRAVGERRMNLEISRAMQQIDSPEFEKSLELALDNALKTESSDKSGK